MCKELQSTSLLKLVEGSGRMQIPRFVLSAFLLFCATLSTETSAQASRGVQRVDSAGHAFSYGPMSKTEIVAATNECAQNRQPKKFRVTCSQFLAAANSFLPGKKFTNHSELANYLVEAAVVDCRPETRVHFARIRLGRIEDGWVRNCRRGEMMLFHQNDGLWILSLLCANIVTQQPSVRTAVPAEPPPRIQQVVKEVPVFPKEIEVTHRFPEPLQILGPPMEERSFWSRHKGKIILGTALVAGAVTCAIVCRQEVTVKVLRPKTSH